MRIDVKGMIWSLVLVCLATNLAAGARDIRLVPASGALGIYWQPSETAPRPRGYQVDVNGQISAETTLHSHYLEDATPGRYSVKIRPITQTGEAGAWSAPQTTVVSADLPPAMTTVLTDQIRFNGATLTLDRPMPVAETVDGRPIIISGGQSFHVVADTPVSAKGKGNGMMRDPAFVRTRATQGFDELMERGNDTTTRVDYVNQLNVAPSRNGPLFIERGAATSLVKSIRKNQVQMAWRGKITRNWMIGGYAVFSVLPHPLPQDAYRPAITALDKIKNLKFARHYNASALRRLPPPPDYPIVFETVLAETARDHAFFGETSGERQNTYGPDDDYSAQWMERRKSAFRALHSTLPEAQKRVLADIMITHAIDLEAIADAGWTGQDGAGQGLGFIEYLYFAGFLLKDAGLLEKARAIRSSEFGTPHYFTPAYKIGQSVPFPSGRGRGGKYDQTWFQEHLDTVMIQTSGDGSLVTSRYSSILQEAAPKGILPVVLLQNGPDGINGIEAITGTTDEIGPANPTSAPIAAMDVFRSVNVHDDQKAFYDAWRRAAGPPYEEQPKQLTQDEDGADRFQAIGRGVRWHWAEWDFVSGTYDSAIFRYSLDKRSWTEVPGQDRVGRFEGLMVGVPYYVGLALRDTKGRQGIFSPNFAFEIGAPVRGKVVPFGASIPTAPQNTRKPVLTYRTYPDWRGEHFTELLSGAAIPREVVTLYPSVGDWVGFPVPQFTWRIRRNGVDVTEDAPFGPDSHYTRTQQDYSTPDQPVVLDIVITGNNGTDPAIEVVSDPVLMPLAPEVPKNVLIDAEFTRAFALDQQTTFENILTQNGRLALSNASFSSHADTPGYLRLNKTDKQPWLRIPLGRAEKGAIYELDAQFITQKTNADTKIVLHAGATRIILDSLPPNRRSPGGLTSGNYSFSISDADVGEMIFLNMRLTTSTGGRGGGTIGLASLKVTKKN